MVLPISAANFEDAGSAGENWAISTWKAVSCGTVELIAEVAHGKAVSIREVSSISTESANKDTGSVSLIEVVRVTGTGCAEASIRVEISTGRANLHTGSRSRVVVVRTGRCLIGSVGTLWERWHCWQTLYARSISLHIVKRNACQTVAIDLIKSYTKWTDINTTAWAWKLPASTFNLIASSVNNLISFSAEHASIVGVVEDAVLINCCTYSIAIGLA
jgi:hypothetical protein